MARGRPGKREWSTTAEACKMLKCTRDLLDSLRNDKSILIRDHWVNLTPKSSRATYRYDVPAIIERLAELEEQYSQGNVTKAQKQTARRSA